MFVNVCFNNMRQVQKVLNAACKYFPLMNTFPITPSQRQLICKRITTFAFCPDEPLRLGQIMQGYMPLYPICWNLGIRVMITWMTAQERVMLTCDEQDVYLLLIRTIQFYADLYTQLWSWSHLIWHCSFHLYTVYVLTDNTVRWWCHDCITGTKVVLLPMKVWSVYIHRDISNPPHRFQWQRSLNSQVH